MAKRKTTNNDLQTLYTESSPYERDSAISNQIIGSIYIQ